MYKILVIEDDILVLENLIEMLEDSGYYVVSANNGRIGIERALQNKPDLIICDILMPEYSGYDVLKSIRQNPDLFDTPFIFLTAISDKNGHRYGMDSGADDYIVKPYKNSEILNAVKSRISKSLMLKQIYTAKIDELTKSISNSLPFEVRSPLFSILGFSQIMLEKTNDLSKSDLVMMSEYINFSGKKLLRVINNYIYFIKFNNYSICPEKEYISIVDNVAFVIQEAAFSIAMEYGRLQDIKINITDCPIQIPSELLTKIIEELIDNAFKYSDSNTEVLIFNNIDRGFTKISVTSKGKAISSSHIKSILSFDSDLPKTFEQQGIGLGLAIVFKIIECFKGNLAITAPDDKTTVFTVSLPVDTKKSNFTF
ncbi:MAG: hybrid sensor histidine kinase/response regulator [Ignavibacteria bacterium]|nr:hybrid sensor histidine kinase/response regulator [Ignavibacteria bacterium]